MVAWVVVAVAVAMVVVVNAIKPTLIPRTLPPPTVFCSLS